MEPDITLLLAILPTQRLRAHRSWAVGHALIDHVVPRAINAYVERGIQSC